ncbi:heterokaryon incompatibility protein-domain-containing protein [Lophiotrema nucula]|uniref:Heterokaryon incompatibility protein-domain-containing protein n=1 Tax=Lophiotrema nucula TaxID=690887 RepID=A0A6A5YVA9_9PLEO|nr:heterokaryon incompatibility protein-domain-containing protein [Lophiotrema nucula]
METNPSEPLYRPLDPARQEIRLIEIVSTEPDIVCRLSVVSLLDKPDFFALSYVWGNVEDTQEIFVDGRRIAVTRNIAGALGDVFYHWNKGGASHTPKHSRRLWADAICINQQDTTEQNHQVPLMKTIYPNAQCVFAWLGRPTTELNAGMDFYNMLGGEMQSLMERHNRNLAELVSMELSEVIREVPEDPVEWIQKHPILHTEMGWAFTFFQAPYWSRVWIFQEVALAADLVFICGNRLFHYLFLLTLQPWNQWVRAVHKEDNRPEYFDRITWHRLMTIGIEPGTVFRIKAARTFQQLRGTGFPADLYLNLGISMAMMAPSLSATNPKDYVYGLSGLIGLLVQPDYSPHTTVADVYCGLVEVWLQHLNWYRNVHQRTNPAIEVTCDLWFMRLAGYGSGWVLVPGLPSWAPNLCNVGKDGTKRYIGGTLPRIASSAFDEYRHQAALHQRTLICPAMKLDGIPTQLPQLASNFEGTLRWFIDLGGGPSLYATAQSFLGALVQVLQVENFIREPSDNEAGTAYLAKVLYKQYLLDLGIPQGSIFATNTWNNETHIAEFISRLGLLDASDIEQMEETLIQDSTIIGLVRIQVMIENVFGYRIGFTKGGRLGLFPRDIAEEDEVFLLKGCDAPLVLRKEGDHYVNVGSCFLADLINDDGTIINEQDHGQVKMIQIV